MNKKFIIFLIGLVVAGCGTSMEHPNIFKNLVCKPPCWENITPGITTKKDALIRLSKIDTVDQPVIELNQSDLAGFDDEVQFTLYKDNNSSAGWVYFLDNRASLIAFQANLDITLEQAIELFGVPQSILAFHSNLMWVTFVDPQKGIAFGYSSAGHPDWVYSEIRPEVEISEVMFFDPKQYQQILDSGFLSYYLLSSEEIKNKLHSWAGYGNLDEKYPPRQP